MSQRDKLNKFAEENLSKEIYVRRLVYDGKQWLVRFPKEVQEILNLSKGDKVEFLLEMAEKPHPIEKSKLSIRLIRED